MSGEHSPQIDLLDRIQDFVVDAECGEMADQQWAEFEGLLREDDDACKAYAEYMGVYALLRDVLDAAPDEGSPSPNVCNVHTPTLPASLWQGAVGFLSSGWPVAYLIATVILATGMLIGALVHVSQPEGAIATCPTPVTPVDKLETAPAARITALADCRWGRGVDPLSVDDVLPLGRRIKLETGLVEVAYNTGARVILQGPATYEVESPAGGFLAIGKLTARLENAESQDLRPKTEDPNPKSLNLQISKFVVRTPTAAVTDLGTEFGVAVDRLGSSEVHVLRGAVEAKSLRPEPKGNVPIRLVAGEAAQFDSSRAVVRRFAAVPSGFVRAVAPASAAPLDLIVADGFGYPDGPLTGQNGGVNGPSGRWVGGWFRDGSVGNGQAVVPRSSIATRSFRAAQVDPPRPIYFSAYFTKNGPSPKYAWLLRLSASINDDNKDYDDASIGIVDDRYRINLGCDKAIESFGSFKAGTRVLIVGKLEFNVDGRNERLQAWVDPTGKETAAVVSPPIEANLGWTVPYYVHLRHVLADDGPYRMDDVRIGFTWESVVDARRPPPLKKGS
jgi:hypothetical protein